MKAGNIRSSPLGRPLRVLWLIDHVCYDGSLHGGGRLYMNLLPRLDPTEVQVFPYFLRVSPEIEQVFAHAPVRVRSLRKAKYDPTALIAVDRLCREHGIDVMHLFCYASSTFGRLVGAFRGIPTVIHDFDTQVYFEYPPYLRFSDRLLRRRTGHAFAASSFCRDYMRDVRCVPEDRLEVLFHVIPDSQIERARALTREAARAQLGWPLKRFVFCAVTKLGPDRGNDTLIKAFAQARRKMPDAHLAIVYKPTLYHRVPSAYEGHPWIQHPDRMRADLETLIDATECRGAVELIESLDSPEHYYAASDVFVAPFENVRFSSVNLIESMAYGRPHIVTSMGEPFEVAHHWRTGPIVHPGDTGELAAAMVELERDRVLVTELSARAERAAQAFTTTAVIARLTAVYTALSRGQSLAPVLNDQYVFTERVTTKN